MQICDDYLQPQPKCFSLMKAGGHANWQNPYVPRICQTGERDLLQEMQLQYLVKNPQMEERDTNQCTFTGLTRSLMPNRSLSSDTTTPTITTLSTDYLSVCLSNRIPHTLPSSTTSFSSSTSIGGPPDGQLCLDMATRQIDNVTTTNNVTVIPKIKDESEKKILAWNWESLGCSGTWLPKPFAGETQASLMLKSCINETRNQPFPVKIVKLEMFINDLKYLTGNFRMNLIEE